MEVREIQEKVELFFQENALNDCYFVDAIIKGKKIEVFIDRDGGISFDICHKVSRVLEAILDESGAYGSNYTLDVSSPGVGSPLKLQRQYKNNIGRTIEILVGDQKLEGLLKDAGDEGITVTMEVVVKDGNKKKKVLVDNLYKYAEVRSAKIKVSFK